MPADHAFDIDSTVGRYWLVNGSGFELVERGGRSLGVVEDVVLDPSTQRVDTMVVKRHAMIKRARVPPAELTAVVPAAKVFVIASGSSAALPPTIGRRVATLFATGATLAATGAKLVATLVATGSKLVATLVATGSKLVAALVATGATLARQRWPGVRHRLAVAAAVALDLSRRAVVAAALGVQRAWRWLHEREQVDRGRRGRGGHTTRRSG
jgi:sporulation protein YlmC with PRC-barrel domain